jgi:hypothetical protein
MVSQCEVEIGPRLGVISCSAIVFHVAVHVTDIGSTRLPRLYLVRARTARTKRASFGVEVVVPISAMTISKSSFCNAVVHRLV